MSTPPDRERLLLRVQAADDRFREVITGHQFEPLFLSSLTMQQLRIMIILAREGHASGQELAKRLKVSLATLTGIIDRLVAQGQVARHKDDHDRRVKRIELTEEGGRLMESLMRSGQDLQRRLLAHLDDTELLWLERILTRLTEAAATEVGTGGD